MSPLEFRLLAWEIFLIPSVKTLKHFSAKNYQTIGNDEKFILARIKRFVVRTASRNQQAFVSVKPVLLLVTALNNHAIAIKTKFERKRSSTEKFSSKETPNRELTDIATIG